MKGRYVYFIAGVIDCSANYDGVHLMVNKKHGAHSSLAKAQKELVMILDEASHEREDMNFEIDDTSLSIEYSDGTFEEYYIYKLLVN
jgi:hypothetical protein